MLDSITINIGECHCRRRRFIVRGVEHVPRHKEPRMVSTGNHFFDKFKLKLSVAPDGDLDAPPTWACDSPDVTLEVPSDGLSCVLSSDVPVPSFAVTVTAPADLPSTPDLETVSEVFTGSFSHSKATALAGSFEEIPRA